MQIAANLSHPQDMMEPVVNDFLEVIGTDRYMWDNRDCLSVTVSLGGRCTAMSTVALIKVATDPKIVVSPESLIAIAGNGDPSIWHSRKVRLRTLATVASDRALKCLAPRPELAQALFRIALAATIALAAESASYRPDGPDVSGEKRTHHYKAVLSAAIRFQKAMFVRSQGGLGKDFSRYEEVYREVQRTLAGFRAARRLVRHATKASYALRRATI